jgi:hypothetical protein
MTLSEFLTRPLVANPAIALGALHKKRAATSSIDFEHHQPDGRSAKMEAGLTELLEQARSTGTPAGAAMAS